jgi:tRNA (uracil-5-)-methyltransferase TRM9
MDPVVIVTNEEFEAEQVLKVYEEIASSFSNTRYKEWPQVAEFISSLSSGTSLLDVGCGNGKNNIRFDLDYHGCDTCKNFIKICREKGYDVIFGNIMKLPYDDDHFDNVINIAVLHHISSFQRRLEACNEMVRVLKPGGKMMVTVWANIGVKNKKFIPIGELPNREDDDFLVTWTKKDDGSVHNRYYHLFQEEETTILVSKIKNVTCVTIFFDHNNWIFVLQKN